MMKVLYPIASQTVSNPFVVTIAEELTNLGVDCTISIDDFWNNPEAYDLIHFQWPEAVYLWKRSITKKQLENVAQQLDKIKSMQVMIAITCHNLKPHLTGDGNVMALYDVIYSHCNLFFHMGQYSQEVLQKQYPKVKHVIVPHHLYDSIYRFDKNRSAACTELDIPSNKFNILSFGEFRTDAEREMIQCLAKRLGKHHIQFLVPGFYRERILTKRLTELPQRIYKTLIYSLQGFKFQKNYVDIADTVRYFCAADIVLIQRLSILNSGNLPMAFAAGKVVLGPDVGNVGRILTETGNPTFDPQNTSTILPAIEKARELCKNGKGLKNKIYAEKHWRTTTVAQAMLQHYQSIVLTRSL